MGNLPFFTLMLYNTKEILSIKAAANAAASVLLLAERHAVGTLVNSGVRFMGADQDALQGAVVCVFTMMGALRYGTLDALVCIAVHSLFLLLHVIVSLCPKEQKQCSFHHHSV